VLTAPRNADVPAHLYEGRGSVTAEFVPNEVGELRICYTQYDCGYMYVVGQKNYIFANNQKKLLEIST